VFRIFIFSFLIFIFYFYPVMWKQWWRSYFSFSKADRLTISVLAIIILLLIALPNWYFRQFQKPIDLSNLNTANLLVSKDSTSNSYINTNATKEENLPAQLEINPSIELTHFNPNTVNELELKQLGFAKKSIQHLLRYRAKTGGFKYKDDLKRINGMDSEKYVLYEPYIDLPNKPVYAKTTYPVTEKKNKAIVLVDINTADTAAFIALPYIGSKLANRIVLYRNKLGGFISLNQMKEVFGLRDSVFQLLANRLSISPIPIQQINLNTADYATLKQHPYIGYQLAQAIVNYRTVHGKFQSEQDLVPIKLITTNNLERLKPYIKIE